MHTVYIVFKSNSINQRNAMRWDVKITRQCTREECFWGSVSVAQGSNYWPPTLGCPDLHNILSLKLLFGQFRETLWRQYKAIAQSGVSNNFWRHFVGFLCLTLDPLQKWVKVKKKEKKKKKKNPTFFFFFLVSIGAIDSTHREIQYPQYAGFFYIKKNRLAEGQSVFSKQFFLNLNYCFLF